MPENFKLGLLQHALRDLRPDQAQAMLDVALPALCESLLPAERAALLQGIIERHLGTLLAGLGSAERAALWQTLLPHLRRELPL